MSKWNYLQIPQSVTVNERPKLVIPYDNPATKEIYLYRNEPVNITLKATDDSGQINSLKLTTTSGAADGNASNYGSLTGVTRSNPIASTTNQANATITLILNNKFNITFIIISFI